MTNQNLMMGIEPVKEGCEVEKVGFVDLVLFQQNSSLGWKIFTIKLRV